MNDVELNTMPSVGAVVRVSLRAGDRLPQLGPLFPKEAIAAAWNVGDPSIGTRVHRLSGLTLEVPAAQDEESAVLDALVVVETFKVSLGRLREQHGATVVIDVPCFLEESSVSLAVTLTPDVLGRLAAAECALTVSCYACSAE